MTTVDRAARVQDIYQPATALGPTTNSTTSFLQMLNALANGGNDAIEQTSAAPLAPLSSQAGTNDAAATAVRARMAEAEESVKAFFEELDTHWDADVSETSAARAERELREKMQALSTGSEHFSLNIDPAVYEKMAADPAFAEKMNGIAEKLANHPWFTEEIPGLMARFVSINENGDCVFGFMRRVSENEEDESAIELMLSKMLQTEEDKMQRILIHTNEDDPEKTIDELIQEMLANYWSSLSPAAAEAKAG